MTPALTQEAQSLMLEVFQVADDGKPIPEFEMEREEGQSKAIKRPHHSLKALPAIQSIDLYIDGIVIAIGNPGTDANQMIQEWDVLSAHASKLMGQAYYLDTADRNSWAAIKQTMVHEPGNEKSSSRYGLQLKRLWHGKLDEHLKQNRVALHEGLGL